MSGQPDSQFSVCPSSKWDRGCADTPSGGLMERMLTDLVTVPGISLFRG